MKKSNVYSDMPCGKPAENHFIDASPAPTAALRRWARFLCDVELPMSPAPLFTKQCPTPFGGVGHTRKSGLQAYKKRRDCAYKKRRFGNRRLYVYIRTAFAVPEAAFFLRLFRPRGTGDKAAVRSYCVSPIDAATAQFAKGDAAEALSAHA